MNKQKIEWESKFGKEYTDRNMITPSMLDQFYLEQYGISKTEMNYEFLDFLDRDIKILEVGSNIGNQLNLLSKMGFENLYGIEINPWAIMNSNKLNEGLPIYIIKGDALDLPFKDKSFDLVFTSGVLIHISPDHIKQAITEIYRCSKRYILGFEYYTPEGYVEIDYRGKSNMLWKTDFKQAYMDNFPQLSLIKESHHPHNENKNLIDQMFLLEK